LLLAGMLHARTRTEHHEEVEIRDAVDKIYGRIDWKGAGLLISMGWSPKKEHRLHWGATTRRC
jgi:hypothetical protein